MKITGKFIWHSKSISFFNAPQLLTGKIKTGILVSEKNKISSGLQIQSNAYALTYHPFDA